MCEMRMNFKHETLTCLMNSLGLSHFIIQKSNALLNLTNLTDKSADDKMVHVLVSAILTCDEEGLCTPPSLASMS